jgi:hypothetical protein
MSALDHMFAGVLWSGDVQSALRCDQWQAWRLGERESYALDLGTPETLDDAVMAALGQALDAGHIIAIQHSHAGQGSHTLWQFKTTRSKHKGIWRDALDGGRRVFVGKLEAKLLVGPVALAAPFEPTRPFDAFRDDPVGRDVRIVEGEG